MKQEYTACRCLHNIIYLVYRESETLYFLVILRKTDKGLTYNMIHFLSFKVIAFTNNYHTEQSVCVCLKKNSRASHYCSLQIFRETDTSQKQN